MAYLLGIDIGTTGARAIIVDSADGRLVASGTAEYSLYTPRPLWAEQDANAWWTGTCAAVRAALAQAGDAVADEIAGIGLSGQMHGVVLLDDVGEVIGRSLIWADGRTAAQCSEMTEKIGVARLVEITNNVATVGMSAPKLLWLRTHKPEEWARARTFLLPKDFVRYKLTGTFATEVSDASGTLLLDVPRRQWSQEIADALDIPASMLPPVYESVEVSARVSAAGAAATGLKAGVPVVGGGGDQAAGGIGNGIIRPGVVSATIGSSGVVFAYADKPIRDPLGRVNSFCGAAPGSWFVMGVTQGAGLSLRWLRDELGHPERAVAARDGADAYDLMINAAAGVAAGSDGLLFLPYLMGERTPHLDPQARGVWFGLTAATRWPQMVRSVLEGVAYSLNDGLELITGLGAGADEIRLSGGGARGLLWRQILADVFGTSVTLLNVSEGGAYGAALLAGVGAGVWPDVAAACAATLRPTETLQPDPMNVATYRKYYAIYTDLYPRLKPAYAALQAAAG